MKKNCQTKAGEAQETNSNQGRKRYNKTWLAMQEIQGAIIILDPSIFEFDAISPRY